MADFIAVLIILLSRNTQMSRIVKSNLYYFSFWIILGKEVAVFVDQPFALAVF